MKRRLPHFLAAFALAALACAPLAQAADYYNMPAAILSAMEGSGSSSITGAGSSKGWSTTQGGSRTMAGITAEDSTYHVYTDFFCRSSLGSCSTPATTLIQVEPGITWTIFGKQSTGTTTMNNVSLGGGSTLHYFNNGDGGIGTLAGSFQMADGATLQMSGRYFTNGRAMTLAASAEGTGAIVACRYDNDGNYTDGAIEHSITGDITGFTGDIVAYDYGSLHSLSLELVNASSLPGDPAPGDTAKVVVTNGATLKISQNWVSPANRAWDFGSSGKPTIYVATGKTVEIRGAVTGLIGFTKTGGGTLLINGDASGLSKSDVTVSGGDVFFPGLADSLKISSSLADVGSPSPAYGDITGLAASQTVAVSCGDSPWTNATVTAVYVCTGWKLYDADNNVVSNGTDTSFSYVHPDPAAYRRLEWQWAAKGGLPPGYTQYTFIQGNATDYNDAANAGYVITDIFPDPSQDTIDASFQIGAGAFSKWMWCARAGSSGNSSTWSLLYSPGGCPKQFRFDYYNTVSQYSTAYEPGETFSVSMSGNTCTLTHENGASETLQYSAQSSFDRTGGPLAILVGGTSNGSTYTSLGNYNNSKLYSFTITRGGAVRHSLVPVMRDSDSKPGLYDTAAGVFYPGDGSFTMGDVYGMDDTLAISSSPADIGSPTPAFGTQSGLSAGQTVSVSCCTTSATNAAGTIQYSCTGWKLYDVDGLLVDSGATTSFTYAHPGSFRRLEWQWTVSSVKGTVAAGAGGSISPSGEAWYAVDTPVTVTATPDSGNPVVCWVGTLPAGISARSASVTFTPAAPFDMKAMFIAAFHVATDGNDGNPGTKASPLATIGAAVTAAKAVVAGGLPSSTVVVADGTYTLSGAVTIDSPVIVVGESGNRDAVVVRASANNRAFALDHASATVSGITVLGGGGNVSQAGGNINIGANGGIVTNCVVANGCGYHGGNIAMGNPSPSVIAAASSLVVDCVVSNGTDTAVAGSWVAAGNIYSNGGRILRCVIADGFTQNGNGGGNVRIKDSIMENCLITGGSGGNAGASIGSGVGVSGSSSRIVNCTFVGNRPPDGTSKLAVRIGSTGPKVVNCVIYGNGSGGQDVENDYKSCFINCAFSSDGVNCADTVSPVTNLTVEAFKNYAGGNYTPKSGGVLVDAGSNELYASYATSATDLAGNPRIIKKIIDIGCYEALSASGFQLVVR